MMAGSTSSEQRPDRLMRTACPSEDDSSCNTRPVHRCARDEEKSSSLPGPSRRVRRRVSPPRKSGSRWLCRHLNRSASVPTSADTRLSNELRESYGSRRRDQETKAKSAKPAAAASNRRLSQSQLGGMMTAPSKKAPDRPIKPQVFLHMNLPRHRNSADPCPQRSASSDPPTAAPKNHRCQNHMKQCVFTQHWVNSGHGALKVFRARRDAVVTIR